MNDSRANISLHFPLSFSMAKLTLLNRLGILGVIFDKNLTFCSHISAVGSSCFYHMQGLQRIRRHLDLDSAKLLATAFVTRHLDYCISLFYGIADLTRLLCVQNQLVHLATSLHLLVVFHCFIPFIGC